MFKNLIRLAFTSILLAVVFTSYVKAQARFNQQEIIPKTPTVSSFEKFLSDPVDLHTGKPNVSIPIHSLSLKNLSVPLVLRYNSSGTKLDELADIVGLGWSLSAGGVVSSNVNGLPDPIDWTTGYYSKISNPSLFVNYYDNVFLGGGSGEDFLGLFEGEDIEFLREVYRGNRDSQPDTYFYSTPTISGKFFFDENGIAHTIPYSKVKIARTIVTDEVSQAVQVTGYTIWDEEGNKYEFTGIEHSNTSGSNGCNPEAGPSQSHRSFHLTKITTPLNEVVEYFYTDYNYSIQNPQQGSRSTVSPSSGGDAYCSNLVLYPCITTTSTYFTGAKRLDRITTTRGDEVKFIYAEQNRKDIPLSKALSRIEIYKLGVQFKKFLFTSDYFYSAAPTSTNPNDFRLKLLSVQEENKEPYVFDYFGGTIPPRLSESKDHWGFSGGGTLFPPDPDHGFSDGGSRNPNLSSTESGVLKKVTYPTKGFLEFEYELNNYFVDEEYLYTVNEGIAYLESIPDDNVSLTFTVPSNAYPVYIQWNNTWDGLNVHNDWCYVKLRGPNNYATDFYSGSPNNNGQFYLTPGAQYTIEIETFGTLYSGNIYLYYKKNMTGRRIENRNVGGLRTTKIKNCPDGNGSCLEKIFEYSNGLTFGSGSKQSSGVLFYEPRYITETDRSYRTAISGSGNCDIHECNIVTQSSSSLTPLTNSQGAHIAYGMVTVYNKNSTVGKEVHKFLIDASNNKMWVGFPFPPLITYDWLNGLPYEHVVYDANNNLVSQTKYHYNYTSIASRPVDSNEKVIYGVKVDIGMFPLYCADNGTLTPVQFVEGQFALISSWHYMTKKEETQRDENGNLITTVTDFFYDNPAHIQKTRQRLATSRGMFRESTFKYPLDYDPNVMNGTIGLLNTANIVSPVISSIERLNGNVTSSTVTEYNSKAMPISIYQLELSQPVSAITEPSTNVSGLLTDYLLDSRYKRNIKIQYNSTNDLIEISNDEGDVTGYVWGYKGSYPIAEVKNATYNQISTALGSTILNDLYSNATNTEADIRSKLSILRTSSSLSAAHATTLTYHANGSISSITDSNGITRYFLFDNANRLKSIQDQDLNIVQMFLYNYKN